VGKREGKREGGKGGGRKRNEEAFEGAAFLKQDATKLGPVVYAESKRGEEHLPGGRQGKGRAWAGGGGKRG
jgi:hypothetical protein